MCANNASRMGCPQVIRKRVNHNCMPFFSDWMSDLKIIILLLFPVPDDLFLHGCFTIHPKAVNSRINIFKSFTCKCRRTNE